LVELVDQFLASRRPAVSRRRHDSIEADAPWLESGIDQVVYELYGLTESEIALVENTTVS
jgi:hypothetical protein